MQKFSFCLDQTDIRVFHQFSEVMMDVTEMSLFYALMISLWYQLKKSCKRHYDPIRLDVSSKPFQHRKFLGSFTSSLSQYIRKHRSPYNWPSVQKKIYFSLGRSLTHSSDYPVPYKYQFLPLDIEIF